MSETKNIPKHIGLIMDGNRRWAKERGLSTLMGHRKGAEVLRQVSREFFDSGVKNLSLYVFSTENWKRTQEEVDYLMRLIREFMKSHIEEAMRDNIRVLVLGSREGLNDKVLEIIEKTEEQTAKNTEGRLILCINYGGRQEIIDAVQAAAKNGAEMEKLEIEQLSGQMYGGDLVPDLDLIVRTSGEQRLSGFMLWRSAYAEFIFVDKFWPDFDKNDAKAVLSEYSKRKRRFGK